MELGAVLRSIETLEKELELLYERFADLCASEPSVADTFKGLAHEEGVHSDIVSYQLRIFQKNKAHFKDIEIDASEISALAQRARELRTAQRSFTSEEALETAYEMENCAAEHYYLLAGIKSNPEIKSLLKAMASRCTEHHARLARFFLNTGLEVKTDEDFDKENPDH